jgi:RNA recognition motif-containing protein
VFVGNLSFDVTREELVEAFGAAGKVVDAKVPTDRETGRPRGFAFVEFEDDEAAQKAIAILNGKDLKGRALRVNEAENRPPRPAGAPSFRPGGGFRPGSGPPLPPPDFHEFGRDFGRAGKGDSRSRTFKSEKPKGSRRNVRRKKRGFDDDEY